MVNRLLHVSPRRTIPPFSKSLYSLHRGQRPTANGQPPAVVLFGDCFVTYNESHIGTAAIRVLEHLGYRVILPKTGCCGRSMISTGLLADAAKHADITHGQLYPYVRDPNVKAILVAEPSCLSAFKDDWLLLADVESTLDDRQRLAAKCFLIEDFIDRFWDEHPTRPTLRPAAGPVLLHGHCHQKALWGDATSANLLKRLAGADNVTVLPSGCCGMAGAFGYTADHYDVSMKIGELSLFPPVRANPDATVCAPGTSCRHQIHDGTGRRAVHPIEYAARVLLPDAG